MLCLFELELFYEFLCTVKVDYEYCRLKVRNHLFIDNYKASSNLKLILSAIITIFVI